MNLRFFFILFLAAVACRNNNNNATTRKNTAPNAELMATPVNLYVRYTAGDQKVEATADFPNQSKFDADVFFQNGAMAFRPASSAKSAYYRTERNNDYESGVFIFKIKKDDQEQSYSLDMQPIRSFFVKEKRASKRRGLVVRWENTPLGADESLIVLLTDANNQTASFTVTGATLTTEANIPAEMFSGLTKGKGSLALVKKRSVQQNKMKGTVEFYTQSTFVNIVD